MSLGFRKRKEGASQHALKATNRVRQIEDLFPRYRSANGLAGSSGVEDEWKRRDGEAKGRSQRSDSGMMERASIKGKRFNNTANEGADCFRVGIRRHRDSNRKPIARRREAKEV